MRAVHDLTHYQSILHTYASWSELYDKRICLLTLTQLSNHSLFSINYCWRPATVNEEDLEGLEVCIEPPAGSVASEGSAWSEVVLRVGGQMADGQSFSLELVCDVENSQAPLILVVEGRVQVGRCFVRLTVMRC